jgi:hypothetical protein
MINIVKSLLENVKQHARACAIETKQPCQARLMIDVV